tara:strand:+ start:78 stop:593 length:516 start_codon:yes stop_codon:yes gene_type:complete
MKKNIILIIALITIGIVGRIIPHPDNFTPMIAIALLSAYVFKNKLISVGTPIASFWISDIIINRSIYAGYADSYSVLWIYSSVACITLMGRFLLNNPEPSRIVLSSIGGSIIFFILSNFGHGYNEPIFQLITSSFFRNQILGDLLYSGILFLSYSLVFSQKKFFSKSNNFI